MANTSLLTSKTRDTISQIFVDIIDSSANNIYYLFAANPFPYPNDDAIIPTPNDSIQSSIIDIYRNMIFGKHITTSDVSLMIPNYEWTTNTIYNMYDNNDGNLFNKPFYVIVNATSQYDVFKCLYNANGIPSTVQPNLIDTSAEDTFYETSDGYQWKYMFSIPSATYTSFATNDYIPVVENANVEGNAVSGSIDVILVESSGGGYLNFTNGQFNGSDIKIGGNTRRYNLSTSNASSVNNFYTNCYIILTGGTGSGQFEEIVNYRISGTNKLITLANPFDTTPDATTTWDILPIVQINGDGNQTTNAAAAAVIESGEVISINVLNRGENYFEANASVLVSSVVGNVTPASLRVILPPPGGHGYSPSTELGGTQVGISVTFANTENGTIPANNQFRTIGILQSPMFANVILSIENSSGDPGSNGTFLVGNKITQTNTGAHGVVTEVNANNIVLTDVVGIFQTGNTTYGIINNQTNTANAQVTQIKNNDSIKDFETFIQMPRLNGSVGVGTFIQNEFINQGNSIGEVHSSFVNNNITTLYVSNTYGIFNIDDSVVGNTSGVSMSPSSVFKGDLVVGSGLILYINNLTAITRTANNSEQIKLVIGF